MTRSNELLAGLDEKEAASRLEKVGENRLKAKKRRSAVSIFFSQFSDVMIWISDDQNKVPLMFESPILVGKVQGTLVEFKNLKGPLDSKLK